MGVGILGSYPLRADDPEYIGDYELLGRLGSGGMGTVFLGCTPQNRTVAIKVVRADLMRDPEFLGRFRSEVTRARQVPPFCTAEVIDADLDQRAAQCGARHRHRADRDPRCRGHPP